jgi:hypothetical protein
MGLVLGMIGVIAVTTKHFSWLKSFTKSEISQKIPEAGNSALK